LVLSYLVLKDMERVTRSDIGGTVLIVLGVILLMQ
jgi:hypothetical protein